MTWNLTAQMTTITTPTCLPCPPKSLTVNMTHFWKAHFSLEIHAQQLMVKIGFFHEPWNAFLICKNWLHHCDSCKILLKMSIKLTTFRHLQFWSLREYFGFLTTSKLNILEYSKEYSLEYIALVFTHGHRYSSPLCLVPPLMPSLLTSTTMKMHWF